jgi:hypothetical protein
MKENEQQQQTNEQQREINRQQSENRQTESGRILIARGGVQFVQIVQAPSV